MLTLEDLLAPVDPQEFRSACLGRTPLHIPATETRKRALLDWRAFNDLLSRSGVWTDQTLRLVHNGTATPVEAYCKLQPGPGGQVWRPSSRKVEVLIAEGASVVANEVQTLHGPIMDVARMLSRTFAAQVGANVYCSFQDVQAFNSHFDNHDVFAVQTEGEKLWRIYETQLDMPVDLPPDGPETRQWLQQARGKVVQELVMRPGDVLYLPRGRFHDALATDTASLHVTFSVTPLYGRILFSLLDNAAMQLPEFRAYFPPATEDGGRALESHLRNLGQLLASLVSSPAFRDEIRMSQDSLIPRPVDFALPQRPALTWLKATGRPFPPGDAALGVVYDWCAGQARFSREDALAQFDFVEPDRLGAALDAARAAGALADA
ncbi:cupin domain-containing protein [Brevundimonas sp. FT23028]|uniref:cupin domain-containing protein n=1 Tax=Brevundimonas sp. FT23028 TaxID=3393748 RepID=UPI003B587C3C